MHDNLKAKKELRTSFKEIYSISNFLNGSLN
jgi:hypothetical protein